MVNEPPNQHGSIHDEDLIRAMRCNVTYTDVATMPIPLYERMKAMILAMGETSTRKDEDNSPQCGSLGAASPIAQREISGVDDANDALTKFIERNGYPGENFAEYKAGFFDGYDCHQPEPVSVEVSIDKCKNALREYLPHAQPGASQHTVGIIEGNICAAVKAVLDAANVRYAE